MVKSVQEISNNQEMIEEFGPKDAHLIGYIAGCESILMEKEQYKMCE